MGPKCLWFNIITNWPRWFIAYAPVSDLNAGPD